MIGPWNKEAWKQYWSWNNLSDEAKQRLDNQALHDSSEAAPPAPDKRPQIAPDE